MIFTLVLVVHVLVCLVLVASILVQRGKGASMGAAFGTAGSQTVFGSAGAGNFLTKTTSVCAVIFFSTSLMLAYRSSFRRSVVADFAPTEEAAPAAPVSDAPKPDGKTEEKGDAKAAVPAGAPKAAVPPAPVPSPTAPAPAPAR